MAYRAEQGIGGESLDLERVIKSGWQVVPIDKAVEVPRVENER